MTCPVRLRPVIPGDLPIFFEQQRDPAANRMAAFGAADPEDRAAFMARWDRLLKTSGVTARTIEVAGDVAGHILNHTTAGSPSVSYWVGKPWWGQRVATQALVAFLQQIATRPVEARVAKDNIASLKVLQHAGFVIRGQSAAFAPGRGEEVEEYVMVLEPEPMAQAG
ncbi:MAG: GNAT family N-acetyltransferase [Phenylobacterium sp.]|uniref:GNAT family N-acetyltransferase n=1 Tax=Phenylobacterium sp. TaxID=1871053 RepID=UPI002735274A|nr:GNAT family N-acetyltransferase [Phenylobacterium sp.]MDP1642382.1 GNAT family N-acetyltransferase [Phenylobacterium sp.]MDP3118005.1 GNAT family N-acetyltransferase [Phenylobacterium sp.]MDP3383009.1 GNAT family N-acetyltransferase [Phenylobacterium sp.]